MAVELQERRINNFLERLAKNSLSIPKSAEFTPSNNGYSGETVSQNGHPRIRSNQNAGVCRRRGAFRRFMRMNYGDWNERISLGFKSEGDSLIKLNGSPNKIVWSAVESDPVSGIHEQIARYRLMKGAGMPMGKGWQDFGTQIDSRLDLPVYLGSIRIPPLKRRT